MLPNACPKPAKTKKASRLSLKHGKPLKHGKRIKQRNARRKGSSFPKRRDYDYLKWVAEESPCLLGYHWTDTDEPHHCLGPVQVCHVKSRGAGGADRGNVVAMCAGAHDEQHRIGIPTFEKRHGINLRAEAAYLWARYEMSVGAALEARIVKEDKC